MNIKELKKRGNKMGEIKCSCGNIIRFLGNRLLSKKSCPKCGKKISSIQPVTESDEQEKCQAHASKKIAGKCNECGKPICVECLKTFGYFCSKECKSVLKSKTNKIADVGLKELGKSQETAQKISSMTKISFVLLSFGIIVFICYVFFFKPRVQEIWTIELNNYGAVVSSIIKNDHAFLLTEKDWLLEVALYDGEIIKQHDIKTLCKVKGGSFTSGILLYQKKNLDLIRFNAGGNILINGKAYYALFSPGTEKFLWSVDIPYDDISYVGAVSGDKYFASVELKPLEVKRQKRDFFMPKPVISEVKIYNIDSGQEIKNLIFDRAVLSCVLLGDLIILGTLKTDIENKQLPIDKKIHCYSITDEKFLWEEPGDFMLQKLGSLVFLRGFDNSRLINSRGKIVKDLNLNFTPLLSSKNYILLSSLLNKLTLMNSNTGEIIWSESSLGLEPIMLNDNMLIVKKYIIETSAPEKGSDDQKEVIDEFEVASKVITKIDDMLDGKGDTPSAGSIAGIVAEEIQGKKFKRPSSSITGNTLSFITLPECTYSKEIEIKGDKVKFSENLISTVKYKTNFNLLDAASGLNIINTDTTFYLYNKKGRLLWKYDFEKNGEITGFYKNGVLVQTYKVNHTGRAIRKYDVSISYLNK